MGPTESDGTILISSLTAQFPGVIGLKFRNPETNTLRGIRCSDKQLYPPNNFLSEHRISLKVFVSGFLNLSPMTPRQKTLLTKFLTNFFDKFFLTNFSGVIGLKFRTPETNTLRGIRCSDKQLY